MLDRHRSTEQRVNNHRGGRYGTNRLENRLDQTLASPRKTLLRLWSTFPILPVTPWLVGRVILRKSKWEALGAPHDLDHDDHVHHIHLTDKQLTQLPVILRMLIGLMLMSPDAFVLYALAVRRNCDSYSDAYTYDGGMLEPAPCTRS